jgi:DNA polymerase-3 subunit gamma/tau
VSDHHCVLFNLLVRSDLSMTSMNQSLARKYRPKSFSDLAGQDALCLALGNSIRLNRPPQALILCGVRGVGKTTTARIFAKALNCEQGPTPEPCCECDSCKAIDIGNHEDVTEMDGASHTSVDNVRELQEFIAYKTQRSPFRVLIIDEVHMLSQSAFNALLKTLEEPPQNTVFIFATTELSRIPDTILSRCHTYQLKKIPLDTIVKRLKVILSSEHIKYQEQALFHIAKEAEGSLRDALTLTDQIIGLGDGEVSDQSVALAIPASSSDRFLKVIGSLLSKSSDSTIPLIREMFDEGLEPKTIAERLAEFCRYGFLLRDLNSSSTVVDQLPLSENDKTELKSMAKRHPPLELNRLFRTLVKCLKDMTGEHLDLYMLENYLLEWCLDPGFGIAWTNTSETETTYQKQALNNQTPVAPTQGNRPPLETSTLKPQQTSRQVEVLSNEPVVQEQGPKVTSETAGSQIAQSVQLDADAGWPSSWENMIRVWMKKRPMQARMLEELVAISFDAQKIELGVPKNTHLTPLLTKPDEQRKIKESLTDIFSFKGQLFFKAIISDAPETLASIKERDTQTRQDKIVQEAIDHPLTKAAIRLFDAKIDKVLVDDQEIKIDK